MSTGLSPLDCLNYAVDERADHHWASTAPSAGHILMVITILRDAPSGKRCEACAAPQLALADRQVSCGSWCASWVYASLTHCR